MICARFLFFSSSGLTEGLQRALSKLPEFSTEARATAEEEEEGRRRGGGRREEEGAAQPRGGLGHVQADPVQQQLRRRRRGRKR